MEFPILMAAFYGLRRSEIMGLRWQAIDFVGNTIMIDHTVVQFRSEGKTKVVQRDRTKNASSCRSLPLVPQYRELLFRMQERQEQCRKLCGNCYIESDYIYVNDLGAPYQPNFVSQHFRVLLEKNQLRVIRFHDLRHPNVKPRTQIFSSFFEIFQGRTLRSYLGRFLIVQVSYGA